MQRSRSRRAPDSGRRSLAGLLTFVALAGCGASHPPRGATASATDTAPSPVPPPGHRAGWLTLAADPNGQLAFSKNHLTARTTAVRVIFTNASRLPHNLTVATQSGAVIGATPTFRGGT